MFDAGALLFKIQTVGKQAFVQDQGDAERAVDRTGKAAQTAAGQVDKLGTATDATGKKSKNAKAPLDEQAKSTKKTGDESEQASKKQDQQRQSTEGQIEAAKKLSAAMLIAGTAVAAMVTLSVAKNTEFGAAMSNVRAATMASAQEQRDLGEAALDAGADTAYSASEAAAAEEELAKAGQSVSQIIGGSLNGSLALAAAGQLQVARSAEIMATTLTQFRLPAEQAAHVSDVLAAGAGKAQGSVDDLALALSYVGPLAGSVGFSLNETAGTIAYFATQGIVGEKAGTSLRGVLASLQAPSAAANAEMENYKINMFDANGEMLSMSGIAEQLRTRLGGLSEQERLSALGRIFGNESLNAATLLYEGGAAKVDEWTAAVDDSGYAAQQAAIRQDNLAGDVEKLGGAFDTALIRTGSAANDVLRGMVQTVTELVDMYGEAPEPIQATAMVLGVATAAVLLFAGGAVGAKAKFLELKIALDQSNSSIGKTAIAGGLAGLALTGIITIVGLLMAKQAEARARAEAYADALESGADRSSRAFADLADEALSANSKLFGLFDLGGGSAYDAADKLSISLGTVRDAALGSAPALRELQQVQEDIANADTESLMEKYGFTVAEATLAEANINAVIDAVRGNNSTIDEAIRIADLKQKADDESVESSQSAADAYIAEADSVEDLNSQLSTLIETINEANDIGQDAITTNADYQQTLIEVSEQIANIQSGVEGFGRGLDLTTQAGIDNSNMLVQMAKDSQDAAEAQLNLDGNTEAYLARLTEGRQAIIDSAIAMGASEEAAILLADSIYKIPTEAEVKIIAETETAEAKLQRLKDSLAGMPQYRKITLESFVIGNKTVTAEADGGVRYFANGATVSENHVAQIARAGDYRVWAEDETGGESYVPHAPSKRARSEQIMHETARILGGTYIPAGGRSFADGATVGSASPSAPVQVILSSKGGIDLLKYIDVQVRQSEQSSTDTMRGAA